MPPGMRGVVLFTLVLVACDKSESPLLDAGSDRVVLDAAPPPSDTPISLAVDFAVENCPSFDPVALTCTGVVPLAVRFVPLTTTTLTKYLWDFGDLSPANPEASPSHTYVSPGVYPVKIIATGIGGGVVVKAHAGFIVAQANVLGDPCDSSQQCAPGLYCLCPASVPCDTGLARGMCAAACPSGLCGSRQVCASLLTTSSPPASVEPWQTYLCLAGCTTDADCSAALHCRTLPPGPTGIAWVRGCFAEVPADVGDPCRDATGKLRDDLCASGMCADLGGQGMCTMNCEVASCPPDSDCAVLGDGRKLCFRPCAGNFTCAHDALLTCVQPGPGDLGYQPSNTESPNAASTYCAPRPCSSDGACLPTGTCADANGNGHCVRR